MHGHQSMCLSPSQAAHDMVTIRKAGPILPGGSFHQWEARAAVAAGAGAGQAAQLDLLVCCQAATTLEPL